MMIGMPLLRGLLLATLALHAQDFADVKIERLSSNHKFTEGPVWTPDGKLLFTDIPPNLVYVWPPGHKPEVYRKDSGGANGLAFDNKGSLYLCEGRARRVTRIDKKGKVEVLLDSWQGKKLNAPNDIIVRRDGHVYFTDPAFGDQADKRELDFYGVFHINPKGEASLFAKPKGRPNGIALSPNGHILYVTNTDERKVYAYDLDNKTGAPSNERVIVAQTDGPPDGMTVDEKGNLYVTCNGVSIYTPAGALIRKIEMTEPPTNCKFGEGDLQTLFVTARTSVLRIRMPVKGSMQYAIGGNSQP